MSSEKTKLQRKAMEPAPAARVPGSVARMENSPAMLAQRKQIESAFGAAQLAGMPEEELQKKAPDEELQKKAPEEELGP